MELVWNNLAQGTICGGGPFRGERLEKRRPVGWLGLVLNRHSMEDIGYIPL